MLQLSLTVLPTLSLYCTLISRPISSHTDKTTLRLSSVSAHQIHHVWKICALELHILLHFVWWVAKAKCILVTDVC